MRVCDEQDLVGIWECYRESDITGDPACQDRVQVAPLDARRSKMAFMDSQPL